MARHQCPVCGVLHEVSPVRHQFAYGRQLACSGECEAQRRHRRRARYWHLSGPLPGNVAPAAEPNPLADLLKAA